VNFDQWWDFDDDGSRPAVDHGHTQKIPNGRHTGDIVSAEIKDFKFKVTDTNPTGTCLVVTWSKTGFYPVESICPLNWRGLIEAICRAAGVAPPQRGEDWDEKALVGRVATVDVENVVAPSGKEYQRVTKWHAGASKQLPAEPVKRAAARTPAAKAHADFKEHSDADDVPF
jgi:hypothetical protein